MLMVVFEIQTEAWSKLKLDQNFPYNEYEYEYILAL